MKKKYLIFFLSLMIISTNVQAEEIYKDVTDDIEVRYKWYKEIISDKGKYYPLRKITEEDRYDKDNIKYVDTTIVNSEFCTYPEEYYKITPKIFRRYKKVYDAKYISIENVSPDTIVKIYYENKEQKYQIISYENNVLILSLNQESLCDKLLFYVETEDKYKISLYKDKELQKLIMSKEFENEKTSIPSSKWNVESTAYYTTSLQLIQYTETSLIKFVEEQTLCGCSEKYVYKYDVEREYYDNNYYKYIEGYIKDENDYRYYYNGNPIIVNNTIEVVKEKIKEIPKIEYVYIEKENQEQQKNELQQCEEIIKTKIETKIVEKEINKIPKKIYMLIISLSIVTFVLIVKNIIKKTRLN